MLAAYIAFVDFGWGEKRDCGCGVSGMGVDTAL